MIIHNNLRCLARSLVLTATMLISGVSVYPQETSGSEHPGALMAINFRGNINNCRIKFEKAKKARVAYLGGSITYNPGWQNMISDYLRQRFPETAFEFINAGIPSLGSTPGAMRLSRDVLSKVEIDLLFVEAAVNDATNGITPGVQVRGMEGIIYQALRSNPFIDIIMMHFADPDKLEDYKNNRVPVVIQQHEKVAEYYRIPSVNFAKEVYDRILAGEFTWKNDFKNLHPSPFGQKIYFRTLKYFFDTSWKNPAGTERVPRMLPEKLLDTFSYINGHFVSPDRGKPGTGWHLIENWTPAEKIETRAGFVNDEVMESTVPGATMRLKFKGKAIGIFVTSGPDAGIVEYSIDGSEYKKSDQFTRWSKSLHLPWLIMLEDQLPPGNHRLRLKISADKNPDSGGTACRIHMFAVND